MNTLKSLESANFFAVGIIERNTAARRRAERPPDGIVDASAKSAAWPEIGSTTSIDTESVLEAA